MTSTIPTNTHLEVTNVKITLIEGHDFVNLTHGFRVSLSIVTSHAKKQESAPIMLTTGIMEPDMEKALSKAIASVLPLFPKGVVNGEALLFRGEEIYAIDIRTKAISKL